MNGYTTIALRPQKTLGQIHYVGITDLFLDPLLVVAMWVAVAKCPASQSTHQRDGKPVRSPRTWAIERRVRRLAGGLRFSK